MVLVTSPEKPFIYSGKMIPRRKDACDAYAKEIDALYAEVEKSSQENIANPTEWSLIQTTHFVRTIVASIVKEHVKDEDDLFRKGCDRCVIPTVWCGAACKFKVRY